MSYCRREGKDTVMFMTKEDLEKPSTVQLPEPEPAPGLINQDGSINWNCPCLGGMATGPCGVEFREAFQCFHYSTAEPKGSECFSAFQEMQDCMSRYPKVYDKGDKEDEGFSMDDKSSIDDSKESDNSANSSKVDKKK